MFQTVPYDLCFWRHFVICVSNGTLRSVFLTARYNLSFRHYLTICVSDGILWSVFQPARYNLFHAARYDQHFKGAFFTISSSDITFQKQRSKRYIIYMHIKCYVIIFSSNSTLSMIRAFLNLWCMIKCVMSSVMIDLLNSNYGVCQLQTTYYG